MGTTLWLIIAWLLRRRYLSEDASIGEKFFYYGFCAVLTPIIGIPVFSAFMDSPVDSGEGTSAAHLSEIDF